MQGDLILRNGLLGSIVWRCTVPVRPLRLPPSRQQRSAVGHAVPGWRGDVRIEAASPRGDFGTQAHLRQTAIAAACNDEVATS